MDLGGLGHFFGQRTQLSKSIYVIHQARSWSRKRPSERNKKEQRGLQGRVSMLVRERLPFLPGFIHVDVRPRTATLTT